MAGVPYERPDLPQHRYRSRPAVSINRKDNSGMTLLHRAVERMNLADIQSLLDQGANPNVCDRDDNTALHALMDCVGSDTNIDLVIEIARKLINAGCNVNSLNILNSTCLFMAVASARYKIVRFLVDNGANVNVLNVVGQDSLFFGIDFWADTKKKRFEFLRYNEFFQDNDHKLSIYYPSMLEEQIEILKLLIDSGTHLKRIRLDGSTPIKCVLSGLEHSQFILYLLEYGAIVDYKDETILHSLNNTLAWCFKIPKYLLNHAALYEDSPVKDGSVRNFQQDKLSPTMQYIYLCCKDELRLMRDTIFYEGVSVFDMLFTKKVCCYLRNNELVMKYIEIIDSNKFPQYYDLLELKYNVALCRHKETSRVLKNLEKLLKLKSHVYPEIFDKIKKCLTPSDIHTLNKAINNDGDN